MACPVTVQAGKAYVWNAEDVVRLRAEHRIVASLTGNSADHKVASATGGLPCELSPEQFALARDKGTNKYKSLLKHVKPDRDVDQAVKESSLIVQSRASLQPGKSAAPTKAPQTIPLTAATMHSDDHVDGHVEKPDVLKDAVFRSLHGKGYYVTDGAKFGAEYLLYPEDPILFHAQFTVQPVHLHQSISAKLLLGNARGSHAARKHLLIASVSTAMLQGSVSNLLKPSAVQIVQCMAAGHITGPDVYHNGP